MSTFAYHRSWCRKFLVASYVPSAAAGWLAVQGDWWFAVPCFVAGTALGWAAGRHSTLAEKHR
jgi:hypothetical protein